MTRICLDWWWIEFRIVLESNIWDLYVFSLFLLPFFTAPLPFPLIYTYWLQGKKQANEALFEQSGPCPFAAYGTIIVNHTSDQVVCRGANFRTGDPTYVPSTLLFFFFLTLLSSSRLLVTGGGWEWMKKRLEKGWWKWNWQDSWWDIGHQCLYGSISEEKHERYADFCRVGWALDLYECGIVSDVCECDSLGWVQGI